MTLARLLLALLLLPSLALAQVPPERLTLLKSGVNLSHWLWLPQGRTGDARRNFITQADLRLIRDAGMTHVRLPFEPDDVWDAQSHQLKAPGLSELHQALGRCLGAGLAVIVDAHPTAASPWATVDAQGNSDELERFWSALAKDLSATDPERIFLEILNEPHDLKGRWPAAQARIAAAIRAAAPHHTIIVTGEDWGNISGLLKLAPLSDSNIVYSFHFYDPHNFTHQGATWGWAGWKHMKSLSYPSTPEAVAPVADKITDSQARQATINYGRERWDAAKIRTQIEKAATWSREHKVPIYCGEFGAYAEFAPRESRLAWLRDVTAALDELKIGHGMWDYAGGFALVTGSPRKLDEPVAAAIGAAR